MENLTTVQLTIPTRELLNNLKRGKDSHEKVIKRLIEFWDEGHKP